MFVGGESVGTGVSSGGSVGTGVSGGGSLVGIAVGGVGVGGDGVLVGRGVFVGTSVRVLVGCAGTLVLVGALC